MKQGKRWAYLGVLAAGLALAGCGLFNKPPVAVIQAEPTSGPAPLKVAFDGSSSYDPDGHITFYLWNFGDQQTASGVAVSHTYHAPGEFQATLTVTDNWGAKGHASVTIQVQSEG